MTFKKTAPLVFVAMLFCICLQAQVNQHKIRRRLAGTPVARGKIIYTKICLACHMADGGGFQHMNPPLIHTSYVLGDKTALVKIVLNGFKEDVEINGQTYTNNMAPHHDLTDRQIADVLTYVRKSFGNKASAVTLADVKKARALNKP